MKSNPHRILNILALLCILGWPDTAAAQDNALAITPSPLAFCAEPGQNLSTLPIAIATSGATIDFNDIEIHSDGNWLTADPSVGTIGPAPHNVFLIGIRGGLASLPLGTYSGQIVLKQNGTVVGRIDASLTISPVACTSGVNVIAVTPGALAFVLPPSVTTSQDILLTNTFPTQITLLIIPTTTTGQSWLQAGPGDTNFFLSSHTTASMAVTVSTQGLDPGTYRGDIEMDGTNQSLIHIPVTLIVRAAASRNAPTAKPNPLTFNLPFGSAATRQRIDLANPNDTPLNFSTSASFGTGHGWMTISPSAGLLDANATAPLTVTFQSSGLTPGANFGNVVVDVTSGGGARLTLPVTINYGTSVSNAQLSVLPSQLSFSYQAAAAPPPARIVSLSSNAPLQFTVDSTTSTGGSWLSATPTAGSTSGAGPVEISVKTDPAGLVPGAYRGQVAITNIGSGEQQLIPVTLVISKLPVLSFGDTGATFDLQSGSAAISPPRTVSVQSSGDPIDFTASVNPVSGVKFLNVAPAGGKTPQNLALTLNPSVVAGLTPGSYQANLQASSADAGNTPASYPVTLNVTSDTLLVPNLTALTIDYSAGQPAPSSRTFTVGSTGFPLSFSVSAISSNCGRFLSATASNGTTPAVIAVSADPAGLPAGTCNGTVRLTSPTAGNSPLVIPVMLNIVKTPVLTVLPAAINVTAQAGTDAPAQLLSFASTDPKTALAFTLSAATDTSKDWLTVGAASGATPATVTVAFHTAALAPGVYSGRIVLSSGALAGGSATIPVTVTITSAATASILPSRLSFTQPSQGASPPVQTLQLASTIPVILFTASASTWEGGDWLSVTAAGNLTPSVLTVSVHAGTLRPGNYSGAVIVVVPGMANSPLVVPVSLTVVAGEAPSAILNAASLRGGPVAPGEMVTIFGVNLGPDAGLAFSLTPQGTVPLSLGNIAVTFDGHPAPLTFLQANQINAIVPYEIAGLASVNVAVSRNGVVSEPLAVGVTDTAPAIFSVTQTGSGAGAIRNADNSLNSDSNPAAAGSVIQIYATGEGLCPGVTTGSVTPLAPPFPKPSAFLAVSIGGKPAQVQFAGEAPGAVSGLLQVNAIVPDGLTPGPQPVVLTVGTASNTSQGITAVVK